MPRKPMGQLPPQDPGFKQGKESRGLNFEHVKKGPRYSNLKVWNDIPINISDLPWLNGLEEQLKVHFKS